MASHQPLPPPRVQEADAATSSPEPTPLHVLVASEHQDLTFAIFEALRPLTEVRVTGCRDVAQTRYVCALDPPRVVVLDMDILHQDPLALVSLANTARRHTHIVALSDHPVFDVGARFGQARLSFVQKPACPEDLVLLLRLRLDEEPSLASHVC